MIWDPRTQPVTIKKYSNRRLYDTSGSRYITLAELEEMVRHGTDVKVIDAKSGEDLTQGTLVQIILDGRGGAGLLPTPILARLIRLGDDALAEFFGQYVGFALETYLRTRQGVQAVAPYNPLLSLPLEAANQLVRLWGNRDQAGSEGDANRMSSYGDIDPAGPENAATHNDRGAIAALRQELAELRESLSGPPKQPQRKKKTSKRNAGADRKRRSVSKKNVAPHKK